MATNTTSTHSALARRQRGSSPSVASTVSCVVGSTRSWPSASPKACELGCESAQPRKGRSRKH
eukprot:14354264-Alexandrium_andersonii.AAC.1